MILHLNRLGQSVQSLSHEHGISQQTIDKWKRSFQNSNNRDCNLIDHSKIKKEYFNLKQENETLRKIIELLLKGKFVS